MFCPMCGAPNEDDAEFCGNCGAALTEDDATIEAGIEAAEDTADVVVDNAAEDILVEPAPEEDGSVEEADRVGEAVPEVLAVDKVEVEPPPEAAAAPSLRTSGLAVASLVSGIVGLSMVPLLGSILALILGYMARREIRDRPNELTGDGLALAGIVLGWISVGLAVLGFLVFGAIMVCGICAAFGNGGSF